MGHEDGWGEDFMSGGGGGGDGGSANNVINALSSSQFGGNWSSNGGYTYFGSDDMAFIFGAMNMDASGGWGNGHASSFDQALSQYNGGNITADMAREYLSITEGMQVGDLSATSVDGGFNISYTASKTGNSYSDVFTSTQIIKSGLDFLSTQDGNNQESNGEVNGNGSNPSNGSFVDQTIMSIDYARTIASSPGFVNNAYKIATESSTTLKYIGEFTGIYSAVRDGSKAINDFQNGHYLNGAWHATETIAQTIFLFGGGEEIELGWNLGTLLIDKVFEDD